MEHSQVLLVTASNMPKQDQETQLLVKHLQSLGIDAKIVAWDDANVSWSKARLCIIRTPWDYFQRLDEFLQWVTYVETTTAIWNPVEVVVWNSHKRYLIDLASKGLPTIPTVLIQQHEGRSVQDILGQQGWREFVIKPCVSIGAIGAGKYHVSDPQAQKHLDSLIKDGDVLIQRFIPEIETEGEISLIFFEGEFSHSVRKRPTKGEYRVQDHHGGSIEIYTPTKQDLDIAIAAIQAVKPSVPYARVDMVPTTLMPFIMELELIEPDLFFRFSEVALNRFARQIMTSLQQ